MFDLQSIVDSSIPPVDPLDLESFWLLQSHDSERPGVSYATSAILSASKNPSADPLAIFARSTFIQILLQHGLLDKWRNGSEIQKVVFEAVAAYPLPNGLQQAEPDGLIAALTAKAPANASSFRNELDSRRREELRQSLRNPHPESGELAASGLEDWNSHLPAEDTESLLNEKLGKSIRWIPGAGWINE